MFYLYIDESGDLGSQSKYLIFSALIVKDIALLDNIIKNMRRNKFKKELSKANEIKANRSSPEIIMHMIKKLNGVKEAKVIYVILEKEKCYSPYLKSDKNKLYNYVAGFIAKNIGLKNCDVVIRIDKSKTKKAQRDDFDKYFEIKLKEYCSLGKIEINHSESHAWSGLQFADILAWVAFQKYEHGKDNYLKQLTIDVKHTNLWDKTENDQYQ